MQTLLLDSAYKEIRSDPTAYLEKTTKKKVKETPIDPEVQKLIIPREESSRCPKIYGLPKHPQARSTTETHSQLNRITKTSSSKIFSYRTATMR
jgi:hypothetical protein